MQVLLRISCNDPGKLSLIFTMTLQVLQKDISQNRERMIALDKTGTHLKYFSQKQDVILIRNLLSSIQHRWEKIVSRSAERTRHLERGYKEAKQVRANRGRHTNQCSVVSEYTFSYTIKRSTMDELISLSDN